MLIVNENNYIKKANKVKKESSNKTALVDRVSSNLSVVERVDTPKGDYTNSVLATLYGILSDYDHETRNNRWYQLKLWQNVFKDPLFVEALQTKTLYGEPDHPLDVENRVETHIPNISHIVRDPQIFEDEGVIKGYLDILDTPNGRIIKTLLDYGCQLGVSSRGSGDLITGSDGKTYVDPDTYQFVTWDIVARPSNKEARVDEISESVVEDNIRTQVNEFIKNNNKESLILAERLIQDTDLPGKRSLLRTVRSGVSELKLKEDISNSYKTDISEAYGRISELKSRNSELEVLNEKLTSENEKLKNTIESLKSKLDNHSKSYDEDYLLSDDEDKKLKTINDDYDLGDSDSYIEDSSEDYDSSDSTRDKDSRYDVLSRKMDDLLNRMSDLENLPYDEEFVDMSEYIELKEKYEKLSTKYRKVVDSYLSNRCSQLNLDESIVRSLLGENLYRYDSDKLNEFVLNKYKSGKSLLNESRSGSFSNSYLKIMKESLDMDPDDRTTYEANRIINS